MVSDYRFSVDFDIQKRTIKNMSAIFNMYGCPNSIIEIGSFEGYTTFWLSDILTPHNKELKIYAIDPHEGSNDLTDVNFNEIKYNFCYNMEANKNKNIIYIKKYSNKGLIDLINQEVKAQLIFIDGDHKAAEVMEDLVLSWQLLDVGGVIICDDSTSWRFTDKNGTCSPHMSPRMAIESFINCYWDRIEPIDLPCSGQTAFKKLKE